MQLDTPAMNTSVFLIALVVGAVVADNTSSMINTLMSDFSKIDEQDLKKCVRNGDTKALETAKSAGDKFVECLTPMKESLMSMMSSILDNPEGDREQEVKQLCIIVTSINPICHNNYVSEVKPCLSDQDVIALDLHHRILEASSRTNCKNDGKELAAAFRMSELICLGQHVSSLEKCMAPLKKEEKQYGNSSLALPRALMGKGCNLYKNIAPCVEKDLSCPFFRHVLLDGMNSTIKILTPCPGHTDEQIQEVQVSSPTLSKDLQVEEIHILRSIQALLQGMAETSQHQLDLQKGMDARDKQVRLTQEKTFNEITGLMRKILFGMRQ